MIAIGIPEDSVQCRRNADQADQRSDGAGTVIGEVGTAGDPPLPKPQ
jgi:hypothetical protein